MEKHEQQATMGYVRSALTLSRTLAAREITLAPGGAVVVTDALGGKHEFTAKGVVPPGGESVMEALHFDRWGGWDRSAPEREFKEAGHGDWTARIKDGSVTLKPRKPKPVCVEAVADADGEQLSRLRSLYGIPGIDLFVACEGETRTRDLLFAMAAELRLSGRKVKLSLPPEHAYVQGEWGTPQSAEYQAGPSFFTDPSEPADWELTLVDRKAFDATGGKPGCPSRMVFVEDSRMAGSFHRGRSAQMAPALRPAAVMGVILEKSKPTARVVFSQAALDLVSELPADPSAPWERWNSRRAERLASRPSEPKTWHQTTLSVAEAYVAGTAPRGYVSNRSLFFHGPVAYSIYYGNPIAAIVAMPNGEKRLFVEQNRRFGGTKAGTVSSAQGDIIEAARAAGLKSVGVEDLKALVTFADLDIETMAGRFFNAKNEKDYPAACVTDAARVDAWLTKRHQDLLSEVERANKTAFATLTKAAAWRGLEALARTKSEFESLVGTALSDFGDADYYAERADIEKAAYDARQAALKELRRAEAFETNSRAAAM